MFQKKYKSSTSQRYQSMKMPSVRKNQHQRLRDNLDFLTLLAKAKRPEKRRNLLEVATAEQLRTIIDCIKNVLYSDKIPLTSKDKRALKKHKSVLITLANKRLPAETRRDLLCQRGGFLPALIPPILAVVGSLLGGLLNR